MSITKLLPKLLLSLVLCSVGVAAANAAEDTFTVELKCSIEPHHVDTWLGWTCTDETIKIPRGRPIYALLVSGFDQNSNLDMVHWYDFARCLLEKGAYVHHARWNNLLHPYMKAPLHSVNSVPSHGSWNWGAGYPHHDMYPRDFPYSPTGPWILLGQTDYRSFGKVGVQWKTPNKAIPAEDYQFQKDAEKLLTRIREENPDAMIILVGHSMGGDAVVRLADSMPANFDIELLAPIDPVGNRTCVPGHCGGLDLFTRYHTVREDSGVGHAPLPPFRKLGKNIKYLYHRWQHESVPPWDRLSAYEFNSQAETSIQSSIPMNPNSGLEVPGNNLGGWFDGHGEIVGFRGSMFNPLGFETNSEPLALKFEGNWPRGDDCKDNQSDADCRVYHLKKWEDDPNYVFKQGFEPWNPGLCRVSRDMCNILDELLAAETQSPVADAGPDQVIECSGPNGTVVTLDGSGSTDPEGDPLSFSWSGPFGDWTGQTIYPELPLGTHSITLTVDDGNGNTDTDTLSVTVADTTPPSLSVSLSPTNLWPPNHKMRPINASIRTSDACDATPNVKLVSIISSEPDNGVGDGNTNNDIQGASIGTDDRTFLLRAEVAGNRVHRRIYTVTYSSTDTSGNVTEDGTARVIVTQSRAGPKNPLR